MSRSLSAKRGVKHVTGHPCNQGVTHVTEHLWHIQTILGKRGVSQNLLWQKGGEVCHRTSFGKRGVKHVAEHPRAPLASGGKACHRTPVHVTELLSQQESEAYHRAPSEKGGVMHVRGQLWQMRVNYFAGPLFGKLGVQHIKKPLEVKHATEPFCQKGGKACQRASLAKKGSRHASLAKGG